MKLTRTTIDTSGTMRRAAVRTEPTGTTARLPGSTQPGRTTDGVPRSTLRGAVILFALLLAGAALAASLPNYYPAEGFQRTGRIDAVIAEEQRIVINDLSFRLADNLIVHTPNSFSVPRSRLREGIQVGYRITGNRQIVEIWLLPRDYQGRRGR